MRFTHGINTLTRYIRLSAIKEKTNVDTEAVIQAEKIKKYLPIGAVVVQKNGIYYTITTTDESSTCVTWIVDTEPSLVPGTRL